MLKCLSSHQQVQKWARLFSGLSDSRRYFAKVIHTKHNLELFSQVSSRFRTARFAPSKRFYSQLSCLWSRQHSSGLIGGSTFFKPGKDFWNSSFDFIGCSVSFLLKNGLQNKSEKRSSFATEEEIKQRFEAFKQKVEQEKIREKNAKEPKFSLSYIVS